MYKVLLLQSTIVHYRHALFQQLGERPGVSLTVGHCANDPVANRNRSYASVRLGVSGMGSLRWQYNALAIAHQHDVVIAMFDVHWISSVLLAVPSARPYKLIYWGHGLGRRSYVHPIRISMARRADALLLYGEQHRAEFVSRGIPDKKLFVAPNTLFVKQPGRKGTESRTAFIFVGRLQPRKRLLELLGAFALAVGQLADDVTLEIVGDGPLKQALEGDVLARGLGQRVRFHGEITDDRVLQRIFQKAIAYVSPGAVGLGVLHSFAHGVPVVTSANVLHGPEFENVENGVNGIIYNGSEEELASVMITLAGNPTFAERLGEAAVQHYRSKRSMDRMVDGFVDAISYVIGREEYRGFS